MTVQRISFWRASGALLALAVIGVMAAAPAQAQKRLMVGATATASSHYAFWAGLSQLINEKVPGVNATTVETGASVDNMRRALRGQIDLGLSATTTLYQAHYASTEAFKQPMKFGLLFSYAVIPQTSVVRADSGVTSYDELNGKRFNPGIKGSATENLTEQVFRAIGVEPEYVRGATADITTAIKDNRIVGYVKSPASLTMADASTVELATFIPVRILSLNDKQVADLREKIPELGIFEAKMTNLAGNPSFRTWGFGSAGFASLDLDEDTVYAISKAVFEDKTILAAAFNGVTGEDMIKYTLQVGSTPLHPGVARYFREKGIAIPDAIKPAS